MNRFLQFGTSRFLQAHADLFIDESLGEGQVCVVQSSGSASTVGRLHGLAASGGFPLITAGSSMAGLSNDVRWSKASRAPYRPSPTGSGRR